MKMDLKYEPDVIPNFIQSAPKDDFGPNLIRLQVTNQIKELQTVIRDRFVEKQKVHVFGASSMGSLLCREQLSKFGVIHSYLFLLKFSCFVLL